MCTLGCPTISNNIERHASEALQIGLLPKLEPFYPKTWIKITLMHQCQTHNKLIK